MIVYHFISTFKKMSWFTDFVIVGGILTISYFFFLIDSTMYAHFLFEAFDTNNNGSVSFEVNRRHALIVFLF